MAPAALLRLELERFDKRLAEPGELTFSLPRAEQPPGYASLRLQRPSGTLRGAE